MKYSSKKTRQSQLRRLAGRQLLFQTCPYEAPGPCAEKNRPSGFFLHVEVGLHHRALVLEGGWNYRQGGEAEKSLELELNKSSPPDRNNQWDGGERREGQGEVKRQEGGGGHPWGH